MTSYVQCGECHARFVHAEGCGVGALPSIIPQLENEIELLRSAIHALVQPHEYWSIGGDVVHGKRCVTIDASNWVTVEQADALHRALLGDQ